MGNFRVGQKVVCIDGKRRGGEGDETFPVLNGIYTVREIEWCSFYHGHQIRLVEIRNTTRLYSDGISEASFSVDRFRPLISQADDVEMFRRISEDSFGRLEAYEEILNEQFYVDETHQ